MPIRTIQFSCGQESHTLTMHEFMGSENSPVLLVTAGVDGDEYAGIEAAKELIEIYASTRLRGIMYVVPIVNMPGYERGVSYNPHDKRYPKHIFPGKSRGSCSERMIWNLWKEVGRHADMWIDLHGGARNEHLYPFVWFFKTGNKERDMLGEILIARIPGSIAVCERAGFFSKPAKIARAQCLYAMVEAGERGRIQEKAIEFHQDAVRAALLSQGMMEGDVQVSKKKIFSFVQEYHSPSHGVWKPKSNISQLMDTPHHLGTLVRAEHGLNIKLDSVGESLFLWSRVQGPCRKGDLLIALAKKEQSSALLIRKVR